MTVSRPRCGCHSNPDVENQSSLSSRNGSIRAGFIGVMSTLRSSTCESGPEGDLVLDADDGAPRGAVSGLHGVSLRVFELGRRLGWEKSRLHPS